MIIRGTLACTIGAGLICVALVTARQNATLLLQGERTFGNISAYQILGAGQNARYSARATFIVDGQEYLTRPEHFTKKRRYDRTELVEVVYLIDKPKMSKIAAEVSFGTKTFLPAGIGVLGILFGIGLISGRITQVD